MEPNQVLLYVMALTTLVNMVILLLDRYPNLIKRQKMVKFNLKEKIVNSPKIRKLVYDIAADLIPRYKNAGVEKGSEGLLDYIEQVVYNSIILGALTLVVSAILTLIFKNMFMIFIGLTGFLTIFYPYIDYLAIKGERDKAINNELPFFIFTTYIYQESGQNIDQTFNHVMGRDIFRWIRTESKIILTDLMIHTQNLYTSLRARSSTTKAVLYRRFLDGYAGLYATGGNLLRYLEHQLQIIKQDFKARNTSYIEKALMISEVNLILTVILPTVIIGSASIGSQATSIAQILTTFFLIVYTFTVVLVIEGIKPKMGTGNVKLKPKMLEISLATTMLLTSYLLSNSIWFSTAISIITFAFLYGYRGKRRLQEIEELEEPLPNFIRNIADYKAAGKSIYQGIALTDKENKYNKRFSDLLNQIKNRLTFNATNVNPTTGIWLVDYVFDNIDLMQKSGGGNTDILMELANLIEDTKTEKDRVKKETSLATYLTYLSPLLFTFVTASIFALAEIVTGNITETQILPLTITQTQKEWIYQMIIIATASNAFISKYVQEGTYENTIPIALALVIASVCVLEMEHITQIIRNVIGGT
ncbi:MAG: hypothetical protein QXJ17_02140 [Nitrososphaeria archaeon]